MLLATAISINQVPIHITSDRWQRITLGHPEVIPHFDDVVSTIENPHRVFARDQSEYMAIGRLGEKGSYLVVLYRELTPQQGLILTAYVSNRYNPTLNQSLP